MKNKYIKTELPITIVTDDEYKQGDNLENTRQKIERAAIYLKSIFNLLKTCAICVEGQADKPELSGFFEDAINHADIGYGLADSIIVSASCLTEFQPDETTEIKTESPNFDSLANHIAFLLNNPDLPEPIYEGLQQGITDAFNSYIDQTEINDETKTAEYIAKVLRGFRKVETRSETISPEFFTNQYKQTGERIERVLASDNVSNGVKNILEALVNEAANEAGFSFPETDEIALKLPKIFAALGKQKSPFVTYFSAIETTLNHGGAKDV